MSDIAPPDLRGAEAIKSSDLLKLMTVVGAAAGLWNALEKEFTRTLIHRWAPEWRELGEALRDLGLPEAT